MPRRKDVTLDTLHFEWGADGNIASARQSARSRPMPYELGRVLLALAQAGSQRNAGEPDRHGAPAPSTSEVGRLAQLTERETRAALRDLFPTSCIKQQRVRLGRQRDFARWAQGFELAPQRELWGPGRRPRLCQLALLVEPNKACGDLLDVILRRIGVLAVQVVTVEEALRLLKHIGFDLVVLDAEMAAAPAELSALMRASHAAACGPAVLLSMPGAQLDLPAHGRYIRAQLTKPFTPQAFESTVSGLGIGTAASRTEMRGIGA